MGQPEVNLHRPATAATAATNAMVTAALRSDCAAVSRLLKSFPACGRTRLPRRRQSREMKRPAPARVLRPMCSGAS